MLGSGRLGHPSGIRGGRHGDHGDRQLRSRLRGRSQALGQGFKMVWAFFSAFFEKANTFLMASTVSRISETNDGLSSRSPSRNWLSRVSA